MDQKPWLWKKRSTEKTLIADKASNSSRKCEDEATEVQKLVTEKTNLEKELQTLNEKLSFALSERDAKDSIAKKQVKIAEEAIEGKLGWEKAESEALSLKQEIDKVSQQKSASEQRTSQLDAALKECMHELRLVREEQAKRVHNAVIQSSEQFKKIKFALESENTQLIKALSAKENVIADFNVLRSRVETTEKENASLKYEIRVVEKELDIRNEEIEFNRRMNNTISKQLDESLKKIARLETECQSLRLLVRKRLPGPTTLGKMRSEVKSLEKDRIETMRRKKSNLSPTRSNAAFSDVGSDESWASALISEPEHKLVRISEMSLMDDFAEMEKLAVNNNDMLKAENASVSIQKVLELLEGIIIIQSRDNGYTVRVFQWKTDELSDVLQKFIRTCNDLLNGAGNLENFAREVANNLEWVLNHCFSIRDVSSMKDAIVTRLGWDEWRSESEVDGGWANKESEIVRCESKDVVEDVGAGLEAAKRSDSKTRNEIEKPTMVKEDEFRKACQRILDLENELENTNNSCERLEETCHNLKMELKSMVSKEVPDNGKHWEKQLQHDWEITAASEKLTECQETIYNLGKQLKALASPSDASLFDKVISTPVDSVITSSSTPRRNISRRSSLLNKMAAEDNFQISVSNETEKDTLTGNGDSGVCTNEETGISSKFINGNRIIDHEDKSGKDIALMDIVPYKKNGGRGFFKKMFWRQRKGNSRKKFLLIGCN
ncbi:hypothetical protein CASFOL_015251 [Castilleja foliolosa]|uniref:Filament-like plant protein 7 n=1 Tax=Castilleja foliolosa TaxID=1961234 RepID=A0ABD3DDK5_9LAMI